MLEKSPVALRRFNNSTENHVTKEGSIKNVGTEAVSVPNIYYRTFFTAP